MSMKEFFQLKEIEENIKKSGLKFPAGCIIQYPGPVAAFMQEDIKKAYRLFLILKSEWFFKIASGDKRIEYRDNTSFWKKRIWEKKKQLQFVEFQLGYNRKYPRLLYRITDIKLNEKINKIEVCFKNI